jgi:transcriptional regulator with XRE-family HTH domain
VWPMAVDNSELDFNSGFVRRVKEAREAMGWTQAFMAHSLGIPFERYKKYEQRSPLPHYLVAKFCELTGSDIHYLMTGARRLPPPLFGPPLDRRRR